MTNLTVTQTCSAMTSRTRTSLSRSNRPLAGKAVWCGRRGRADPAGPCHGLRRQVCWRSKRIVGRLSQRSMGLERMTTAEHTPMSRADIVPKEQPARGFNEVVGWL
jgi:hypothetical protein